jgi:hypothetical protein
MVNIVRDVALIATFGLACLVALFVFAWLVHGVFSVTVYG